MNELRLFDNEYNCIIAGVDEAGRGPLAGPVVAAAVIIPDYFVELGEINDSKKLTEKKREKLYDIIKEKCRVGIGVADEKEIDEINILNATFLAMRRALEQVDNYDIVLVDGNHKIRKYLGKQEEIIKGDGRSGSIKIAPYLATCLRSGSVWASFVQKNAVFLPYLPTQAGTFSRINCCAPATPTSLTGSGAVSKAYFNPKSLQASSKIARLRACNS